MDTHLSLEALAEVQRFLNHIEHKWKNIGLQLGLDPTRLDGILHSGQTQGECLLSMIQLWLKGLGVHNSPTWESLCRALEGVVVEEAGVAANIRQQKGGFFALPYRVAFLDGQAKVFAPLLYLIYIIS